MPVDLTLALFADLQEPQSVAVSHDGKWVAYCARAALITYDGNVRSCIWIAQVDKGGSARQLTHGAYNDHSPSFSPDGKHIAFLSDRAKVGSASDIFLLPVHGGEAFQLTPCESEEGIASYKFNHDGTRIAYLKPTENSEHKKQKIKDKNDPKVYGEDWDYNKIHIISVDSKHVRVIDTPGVHVTQFDWSPDGSEIAFATCANPDLDTMLGGTSDINSVRLSDDRKRHIVSSAARVDSLCWHQSGLSWLRRMDIFEFCSAQGVFGAEPTRNSKVLHQAQGTVDCAYSLGTCTGRPVVQVIHGMTQELRVVGTSEPLVRRQCKLAAWDVAFKKDEFVVALVKGSSGKPMEVYSLKDGKEVQLSRHGGHLAGLNLGNTDIIESKHNDDTPVDGFYAVPTTLRSQFDAHEPLPTVIIVHGGPYMNANDTFFVDMFAPAFYMSQGYLVLVTNYRGGQGHGNDYAKTVAGNAAASYKDVIWLVKNGVQEGHIDKDRVAITGWSQGGFMSYLAVTRDDEFHFTAAIPGAGVTDWTSMAMTSDIPSLECALGGCVPWLSQISLIDDRKSSPIYHMDNIKTPMLLLHGEEDARVPVTQAISFHRGMQARNLPCKMVIYPREGHGPPKGFERAHYIDLMQRTVQFLKEHIGST